jgi:hypothetical protein
VNGSIENPQNCSSIVPYTFSLGYWNSTEESCSTTQTGQLLVYSASQTLETGSFIFYDSALTNPVIGPVVAVGMNRFQALSGGYLQSYTCAVQYRVGIFGYSTFAEACQNVGDLNNGTYLYGQGDIYQGGQQLYNDSNCTTPYTSTGWFPSMFGWPSGSSRGIYLNNGILQAGLPC